MAPPEKDRVAKAIGQTGMTEQWPRAYGAVCAGGVNGKRGARKNGASCGFDSRPAHERKEKSHEPIRRKPGPRRGGGGNTYESRERPNIDADCGCVRAPVRLLVLAGPE